MLILWFLVLSICILFYYPIMMIIATSQIINIINKSHHEINSIIRFFITCP